ncbi:RluA family pseudouridine synthase [Candidatus Poriferisodalis sp.]|uniref:RluA family pseudouridine synthase n=1 Tax=Candidatus Poriferisodalis sp. TaxID=3101277 RepID=UPI003B01B002
MIEPPCPFKNSRFDIPESLGGERLDRALSLLTGKPRSATARMVSHGSVMVDGEPVRNGSQRLHPGALIELVGIHRVEGPVRLTPEEVSFDVLHADRDVVVVNKPSGVVTHRGSGHRQGTLADALGAQYPEMAHVGEPDRPGIVHRLDRGTSGVLVCARSTLAYESLVSQLSERLVRRVYAALTRGVAPSPTGTVDAPIGRDPGNRTMMAIRADGRPARTHYRVIETFAHPIDASLLRCWLETGRTHQIRVHLASISLPLLGDLTYGVADPFSIGRPLLHAYELRFRHPSDGSEMIFEAPIPSDFAEALRGFGSDQQAIRALF